VAQGLSNWCLAKLDLGELDAAQPLCERALAMWERTRGADHADVAQAVSNLADIHEARGEHDAAWALHARGLAIREQAFGPSHADVAFSLAGMGRSAMGNGRAGDAVALLERALAIRLEVQAPADRLAETHFALARALWDSRRDRARAAASARAALGEYDRAADRFADDRAAVVAWLAEREAPGSRPW
jgi:tetratricopeptide (TPR) repeat protein